MDNSWQKLMAAAFSASALLTLSCFAAIEEPQQFPPFQLPGQHGAVERLGKLPFTFEEIALYFTNALGAGPTTLHRKCVVFTKSEPGGLHDVYDLTVVVTSVGGDLSVTLLTNADYGMNYFREFIESQFFFPEESEQLYRLFHESPGENWVEMFRFRAQLNVMETADWDIIGLTFSPRPLFELRLKNLD